MEIRQMTIDDYDDIYQLWLSCPGMGLNDLDDSKEGIQRFLDRNPETCFVSVEDKKIIGVIMAGNDGRRGYIYHTAVHPHYQKQGIGSSLVQKVLKVLESIGINKVALVVFARNEKGNAFWEKQGFTTRQDIIYRNKIIKEMVRIDT